MRVLQGLSMYMWCVEGSAPEEPCSSGGCPSAYPYLPYIGCAKIVLSSTSFLWTTFLYFSQFWSFLSSSGYQCQTPLSVPTVWGILLSLPVLVALSCPSLSSLEFLPSFFFCVVYLTSYSSYDLWFIKEHQNQGERTPEGSFSPGVAA